MCELNILTQMYNLSNSTILQDAWERGQKVNIQAWIYDLKDGLIKQLDSVCEGGDQEKRHDFHYFFLNYHLHKPLSFYGLDAQIVVYQLKDQPVLGPVSFLYIEMLLIKQFIQIQIVFLLFNLLLKYLKLLILLFVGIINVVVQMLLLIILNQVLLIIGFIILEMYIQDIKKSQINQTLKIKVLKCVNQIFLRKCIIQVILLLYKMHGEEDKKLIYMHGFIIQIMDLLMNQIIVKEMEIRIQNFMLQVMNPYMQLCIIQQECKYSLNFAKIKLLIIIKEI
ncbi:hypothetical protein IMG5_032580 [Ichthyophthirius multifiliis]|uniref:Uncharacterized protein n=1 Tax=Ichthyophthirius multifiliis TaxID=5932 RepID=G0QLL4_ICHMU|nr:hypothetical protein IMG5_032580 [Ichthyophthirius multifiliis]EGR33891.1 hypothetical protein IMG5_032580 [Ichthyophthirius multifiliis]|eukprot:XP_004039115.1 hypothetical protein IMG5_032580 [Ichthyophthirius multifiliis]